MLEILELVSNSTGAIASLITLVYYGVKERRFVRRLLSVWKQRLIQSLSPATAGIVRAAQVGAFGAALFWMLIRDLASGDLLVMLKAAALMS
jgi:hypothetical protein